MIQKLVMNAVANNKFEALVYSFPSDLCTDSGRAINNRLAHWPETLQGKAKELVRALPDHRQAAGVQAEGHDHQLSQRNAGRCGLLPELGARREVIARAGRFPCVLSVAGEPPPRRANPCRARTSGAGGRGRARVRT